MGALGSRYREAHGAAHRAAGDFGAAQQNAVAILIEREIVDDPNCRQRDAEFLAQLGPQRLNLVGELPRLVDEGYQGGAELEAQNVRPRRRRAIERLGLARHRFLGGLGLLHARAHPEEPQPRRHREKREMRQAGKNPNQCEQPARAEQHPGLAHQLLADSFGEVEFARRARHDQSRRGRGEQRGNLRGEAIADGQNGVGPQRLEDRQVMLDDADEQSRDQIDGHDHDRGDRVASHELADTIHGGVKIRLASEVAAPPPRFFFADTAGVQVGVDRHLLARHRVEGKARGDFGDAARALGHHREVDNRDHDEDHDSDCVVVAHDDAAERLDNAARRARAEVAMEQDEPGRGDVERQPQQRRHQQHGRERGKIQRAAVGRRNHQHRDRKRDRQRQQDVEQRRADRRNHPGEHQHRGSRQREFRHRDEWHAGSRSCHQAAPPCCSRRASARMMVARTSAIAR